MSRSIWKGTLSVGLVTLNVAAFKAVDEPNTGLEAKQLHDECNTPINMKRVCQHCTELARQKNPKAAEVEVPFANIVKGYPHGDKFVVFTPDELNQMKPESTKTIEVDKFVSLKEVGQMYLDTPFYLSPEGPVARRPFAMLRDALRAGGKYAMGTVAMYGHVQLVAIRAEKKGLVMSTVREHKHIRPIEHVSGYDQIPEVADASGTKMMGALIDSLVDNFDPTLHEDLFRKNLSEGIEAKSKGQQVAVAKTTAKPVVDDVMAALEASLAASTKNKKAKVASTAAAATATAKASKASRTRKTA